ncbi:MAG: CoA-transferase [Pseudomonadota bacterium]
MKRKVIDAAAAAALISDGDTVTTSGFVGIGVPEELLLAVEARFKDTGHPRNLTLFFAGGQGDGGEKGLNHLGHEGLLKCVVGGHWGLIPRVAALATQGKIEGYNLPQGVISHLFRDIAAGRPGALTKVGLGTFVDPRIEGGKVNDISTQDLVQLTEIAGQDHLFYPARPIDVALLRGTTADQAGNITMEREALVIDNLAQAMAVKNSGGVVIVQVERTVARGALNPRDVKIPSALVDAVVVANTSNHMQTFATPYSHTFSGRYRADTSDMGSMPLDARKVIARRAAFELPVNGVINLGIGMPEGVAQVVGEEGMLEHFTLTAEPGVIGGLPASGLDFGAAVNITMEREALVIDNLAQAMAVKNSGGVVIVQVERTVARGALNPRDVKIPSALVDAVVVANTSNHMQTFATPYSHTFSGRYRADTSDMGSMPLDARKVIARRAAFELPVNGVINLGIGMPEGVAQVVGEEGMLEHFTLTAEPGVIGGLPASGLDFGAAVNTDAIIPQNAQFDFYDGGGLDLAILGMAEFDAQGNVNVSRFGPRLAGSGGFINISQAARRVVFTGTMTASGLKFELREGRAFIAREGRMKKGLGRVGQITFSGAQALAQGKPVLYVTERAVFRLTSEGLHLTEIAPGLEVERDVLAHLDFAPIVAEVAPMDARIFTDAPMDLKAELLHLDLADRIALNPAGVILFINFENLRVRARADIDAIRARVEEVCGRLGARVDVVVNYDGTRIEEGIEREYFAMVDGLSDRFYRKITRYSGSAFMRRKLGQSFSSEQAAHVFESAADARRFLGRG